MFLFLASFMEAQYSGHRELSEKNFTPGQQQSLPRMSTLIAITPSVVPGDDPPYEGSNKIR